MNGADRTDDYPQTCFFQACRGVFEGGGCRGAAHVGAYEAAIACGINFSEVAGTSAGSIVAALVGAGASPEYLRETVAYLKFSSLLSDPKGEIATPWYAHFAGPMLRGSKRTLGKIFQHGSAYSSARIQEWIDDRLAELLPHVPRPVKFKDLILPTWVVATDLSGRRAKIWSTRHTPEENVAFAVRCSCSIPLFFEPVEAGNDLYVDGGMLSNLPAFVFADDRKDALALGGRVLGFRLDGDAEDHPKWNIGVLITRLIDTAISGATSIQRSILENVSTVSIPTGNVSSTDFEISKENVEFLLKSGCDAVREFIREEHSNLDDSISNDVARYGDDELFDDLAREMNVPGKRMLVACEDTRWFWSLFPSVARWVFDNAVIEVIISRDASDGRERQRRSAMERLGIRFTRVQDLPFKGFILNRVDDRHDGMFITHISHTRYTPTGSVYIGAKHRPIIQSMTRILESLVGSTAPEPANVRLVAADPEKTIELLRNGVNQYSSQSTSITLESVDLTAVEPHVRLIVRRIRSFKYRQIESLITLYDRFDIPFGAPADIYANDSYVSTITPPVLETWGQDLVAIEGNTRLFYLSRAGGGTVQAFIVRGVNQALPGVPVDIAAVLLSTYQMTPGERINGFRYGEFRSIEGAVRPEE